MFRLLFLIAVALWIAYLLDRGWRRIQAWIDPQPRSRTPSAGSRSLRGGELVRCARCGVHVPAQRSVTAGGARYCSEACRSAADDSR